MAKQKAARDGSRSGLALVALFLIGAFCGTAHSGQELADTGGSLAPGPLLQVTQPPRYLYYAASDGSVRSVNLYDQTEGPTVGLVEFVGGNVGTARSIDVDSIQRLLYYAATDNTIRSIDLDTLTAGPWLPSETFGAAVGAGRGFAVHPVGWVVFWAGVSGKVGVALLGGAGAIPTMKILPVEIPPDKFAGANPGAGRQMALDPLADLLYYAVSDGSIASVDLQSPTLDAGPSIPSPSLMGANPGANRRIAFDAQTKLLWYAVTDGRAASIDPVTLVSGPTLASTLFAGANPGDWRHIAVESSLWAIFADGLESGDTSAWSSVAP